MAGRRHAKFIFVTGGVVSSLGKGLAASSLGLLMEQRGLRVTFLKLDPYINVDPGTMNPLQHGEVFVTDDGAETDLDLGHYERFSAARMGKGNNYTSGRIYHSVIQKERAGKYLGHTVQVVPHITDEIQQIVLDAEQDGVDLVIVEIGGTVGDIESLPFLEAIRQLRQILGPQNSINVHVTLVPFIHAAGELKTKPTQHSVRDLREIGIQPDILICRTDRDLDPDIKRKIGLFCNVAAERVVTCKDAESIYEVPLLLHGEGLDRGVSELLNIWSREPNLDPWREIVRRAKQPAHAVCIAVVGKYVELADAYKSLNEALRHGGLAHDCRVNLRFVDSEKLQDQDPAEVLEGADAILVPGGFGERGTEGKIMAIRHAREGRIPFFGICLGLQLAVIEHARNACGIEGAGSREFDLHCSHPVIDLMPEQREIIIKGATMRLGSYPCALKQGSLARRIYGAEVIHERHRHRYEVSNQYRAALEAGGLVLSGLSPDGRLVEIIERPDHPWFLGCQFHPEFKSKPFAPHPLFSAFVRAAVVARDARARG